MKPLLTLAIFLTSHFNVNAQSLHQSPLQQPLFVVGFINTEWNRIGFALPGPIAVENTFIPGITRMAN